MGKYDDRQLVFVTPFTGSPIKYGFMTNVDASVGTALGHTAVTGAYPVGLVIGANAPKPPRATRIRATGAESSFVDAESIAAARAAGWRIRPGKVRIGSSGGKSKCVYVLHEGNKLAWNMPNTLYSRITAGDRTALGILDAAANDEDLIFGVSYPRLPRVGYIAAGSAGTDLLSTFCDPSKLDSLPTGWRSVRASRDKI
jgi:hypothetical protein